MTGVHHLVAVGSHYLLPELALNYDLPAFQVAGITYVSQFTWLFLICFVCLFCGTEAGTQCLCLGCFEL
jgi:hypothetical protein